MDLMIKTHCRGGMGPGTYLISRTEDGFEIVLEPKDLDTRNRLGAKCTVKLTKKELKALLIDMWRVFTPLFVGREHEEMSVEVDELKAWSALNAIVGIYFDGTKSMISLSEEHQDSVVRIMMPAATLRSVQQKLNEMSEESVSFAAIEPDLRADGNLF